MKTTQNHQLDNAPPETRLSADERETSFLWDDSSPVCLCYTANPAMLRKLDSLCEIYPECFVCTKRHFNSGFYEFPKRFVSIRKPTQKKELSQQEREALALRLSLARDKRRSLREDASSL